MAVKDGLQAIAKIFRFGGYAWVAGGMIGGVATTISKSLSDGFAVFGICAFMGAFAWLVGWVVDKFAL